jgi:ATP dependent DNA ligase domain
MTRVESGAVQQEHRRAGLQLVLGVPSGDAPHQHVGAGDGALAGDGWVLEPKWDGIRAIAHVTEDRPRLFTRHGRGHHYRFPRINAALGELPVGTVLDGELACLQPLEDGRVRCRFDRVSAFTVARAPHRPNVNGLTVTLIVFDAVAVAGADLRAAPWSERRARLEELLSDAKARCASRRCSSSTPRFTPPWSPTAGRSRWPSAPAGATAAGTAATLGSSSSRPPRATATGAASSPRSPLAGVRRSEAGGSFLTTKPPQTKRARCGGRTRWRGIGGGGYVAPKSESLGTPMCYPRP